MYGLMGQLLARLTGLTKDLRFYHKPTGEMVAPQIVNTCMPDKTRDWQEDQDFPYVRAALFRGAFDGVSAQPHEAIVVCGIYSPGDVVDGTTAINQLTAAVGEIVTNRGFAPFVLAPPVEYRIGLDEAGMEGLQPHPYHFSKLHLKFMKK